MNNNATIKIIDPDHKRKKIEAAIGVDFSHVFLLNQITHEFKKN